VDVGHCVYEVLWAVRSSMYNKLLVVVMLCGSVMERVSTVFIYMSLSLIMLCVRCGSFFFTYFSSCDGMRDGSFCCVARPAYVLCCCD
jgi:hypothetical protein